MIFNLNNFSSSSSSGGDSQGALNFKIESGNTFPPEAEENTIMVITNNDITEWMFSQEEPENPSEGMIWIKTGTFSTVEFNALAANGITVYPMSVKQYISNEWVDKTAKSYQNGEWVDWITYMYNKGDQCTDLTGGWLSYGYKAKVTFNNDHMLIGIESGYNEIYGMAYTANKIDVSNMNTLYFYIDERTSTDIIESSNDSSKYSTVGISTSPDVRTNGWVAYARIPTGTTQTLFSVDVSTYDGTYYVCVLNAVNGTGHMKCSQVYGM